jgi:predicted RNA binding protein YcfA (HicA-like mRNA interferase family)
VNVGGFRHVRTTGDHLIFRWDQPDDHDADPRSVPLHGSVGINTLRSIADSAVRRECEAFCACLGSNR